MKIKILLMAVVLAGLLFSMSASAEVITPDCGTLDPVLRQINFETTTSFDKFDPSLGGLTSVTLNAEACAEGTRIFTNLDPRPNGVNYTIIFTALLSADIPGVGLQTFPIAQTESFHLFPGESYNFDVGPECFPRTFIVDPAQLDLYKGAGEQVTVTVSTDSGMQVSGSSEWASDGTTFMSFEICPVYEYLQPLFCINGTKINDCTDAGIPGWTISLMNAAGAVIRTTVTDANGDYSFCELAPGAYQVCETTQAGWTPVGDPCIDVTVGPDKDGVDFHNVPAGCISGHKFNSKTNAGLSGWTIQLKDANGAMIRETTTGTGGFYQFCGLAPGRYTVCEVLKAQWKAVSPICIDVELVECDNSEDNDFFNEPSNLVCVCPFFIKNELYNANCNAIYEVDASKGILANDPPGSIVLNPESITIDPKYGTITVEEDGSFVYDPTGATALHTGVYVIFKYAANNGFCDSKYLGVAKIQVSCK